MADLDDFSRNFTIQVDGIMNNIDGVVRKVALVADQAVVMATPVDTGRARSNWISEANNSSEQIIEAYTPGEQGNTAAANTQSALDQAEQVISGYRAGDSLHLTNNLPYIQALNDGSSAQAPANFVEIAIQTAVDAVQNAVIVPPTRGR